MALPRDVESLEVIPKELSEKLAEIMVYPRDEFDPSEIRPSEIGTCLAEAEFRIKNALYPENELFQPTNPRGKKKLRGVAKIGHLVEELRKDAWEQLGYKVDTQIPLESDLENPNGTKIRSHPDIYIEELKLDEEVKTTGIKNRGYLPYDYHIDQLLYRLFLWRKKGIDIRGNLIYFFRENVVPEGENGFDPLEFAFIPTQKGIFIDGVGVYTWEYVNSLEERFQDLLDTLDNKEEILMPRIADNPNHFLCFFMSDNYTTRCEEDKGIVECPWRYNCWAEELDYQETEAFMVEVCEPLLEEYKELKEEKSSVNQEVNQISNRIKEIETELSWFFDNFGDTLETPNYIIKKAIRHRKEYTNKATSYPVYSIKEK